MIQFNLSITIEIVPRTISCVYFARNMEYIFGLWQVKGGQLCVSNKYFTRTALGGVVGLNSRLLPLDSSI